MTSSKVNKKQSALIRNVLCQPFKQKWPLIKGEDMDELLPPLKSCISPMRIDLPKQMSWSELKKLKKDKRKELKQERLSTLSENDKEKYKAAIELRNHIFCGINAVSRGAEKDFVEFALIAGNIEPRILVKPLIQLLYTKEIPVLVVPELKKITRESIGFQCIALGFKSSDKFCDMKALVSKMFNGVKTNEDESEKSEDEVEEEEPMSKIRKIDSEVDLTSIYVYKNSEHKSESPTEPSGIMKVKNVTSERQILSKNARYYLPPVVNRMRSNPLKLRKKKIKKKAVK